MSQAGGPEESRSERPLERAIRGDPLKRLISALDAYVAKAEELRELHHDEPEQEIFDDDVLSFIESRFGPAERRVVRDRLSPAFRIYDTPYSLLDADRLNCLGSVQNRLHVLKARIERGDHVEPSKSLLPPSTEPDEMRPRVFISHSGENEAFYRLTFFLNELGVQPIIAEWLPFGERSVPDQVGEAIESCAAAIVFATRADQIGDRSQPGRGALIETGILRQRFGEKVIYLVEEGVEFGPMADNLARESFTQENLERVFHRLVVELKAYGLV